MTVALVLLLQDLLDILHFRSLSLSLSLLTNYF